MVHVNDKIVREPNAGDKRSARRELGDIHVERGAGDVRDVVQWLRLEAAGLYGRGLRREIRRCVAGGGTWVVRRLGGSVLGERRRLLGACGLCAGHSV